MKLFKAVVALSLLATTSALYADTVSVGVASNFSKPLEILAEKFKQASGHELKISAGATGKLLTQIENGAPFEVFISADTKTPTQLIEEKYAIEGTSFTYAVGKLVLWSSKEGLINNTSEVLTKENFEHLAIANPKTAPYGAAALEVLDHLSLSASLKPKLVQGENINQAYDFVSTGNAELGFVALSQIQKDGKISQGSAWLVPQDLYTPIEQSAVLLTQGKDNKAAQALLAYLKTPEAKAIIETFGYGLPQDSDSTNVTSTPVK